MDWCGCSWVCRCLLAQRYRIEEVHPILLNWAAVVCSKPSTQVRGSAPSEGIPIGPGMLLHHQHDHASSLEFHGRFVPIISFFSFYWPYDLAPIPHGYLSAPPLWCVRACVRRWSGLPLMGRGGCCVMCCSQDCPSHVWGNAKVKLGHFVLMFSSSHDRESWPCYTIHCFIDHTTILQHTIHQLIGRKQFRHIIWKQVHSITSLVALFCTYRKNNCSFWYFGFFSTLLSNMALV